MCGIAGALSLGKVPGEPLVDRSLIRHRGPDSDGFWRDDENGIQLAHRRLAILDLSEAGAQPKQSRSERYVVSYNGEIYNFRSIADELEEASGREISHHSDTEVLTEAISFWGVEKCLEKLVGMFAFAVWDREEKCLSLVRDRLGIKPLYFGFQNGILAFSSELRVLHGIKEWSLSVDPNSVASLLRHNCIPAPRSVYKDVFKLLPGHILRVDREMLSSRGLPSSRAYWSAREAATSQKAESCERTPQESVEELEGLLRNSVGEQMISDVPLGGFLSGGIDSSTVVALMQANSSRPVNSYSIGFDSSAYNEAEYAKQVAEHLGTDHHEFYVTEREAIEVVPQLPEVFDEPFSDSSQIPTLMVSRLARRSVKVCLSGDGGDELFCGYNRYHQGYSAWKKGTRLPKPIRKVLKAAVESIHPDRWDRLGECVSTVSRQRLQVANPGYKLHKLVDLFELDTASEFYSRLVSHWSDAEAVVLGASGDVNDFSKGMETDAEFSPEEKMMLSDVLGYLPDDILTKVDRASMSVSLEARVPILDHRIAEFSWGLPMDVKVRDGDMKWILRQVLEKYVPKEMFNRPKMGFSVPLAEWLRGDLRDWAEDLLSEDRLRREGVFDPGPIREKWEAHISGSQNWQYHLWDVLMFQAWSERWNSR